jgi:3-hydroxypropionate dehydrogenase (NADP+)
MIEGIEKVACIGSGLVGQSWAALYVLHGYHVVLQDISKEKLLTAVKRVYHHMDVLVEAGLAQKQNEGEIQLTTTTRLEDALRGVDFVTESVYESLDVKRPLYAEMDELTPEDVVLASSTSGYMMSEIGRDMKNHPERAIVAHPWNPVHLIPLVELSPSPYTSKETINRTYKLMEDIGRVPVVLKKEAPGFIANRISVALWREALDIVNRGIASVEDVDKAVMAGPGIRWAMMGPYLTYHLGGGEGGIEYLMDHIGVKKQEWLKDMANWTEFPDGVKDKAVQGVDELVGDMCLEELEAWRDKYLISLNKLLWSGDREIY